AGDATNVLIVAGHTGMESGEGVKAWVLSGWAEGVGIVSGVTDVSSGTAEGIRKEVPGRLFVANVSNGNLVDRHLNKSGETNREILGIKLSASAGENITLSKIEISLNYNGITDNDITNCRLFIDTGTIGTYETGTDTILIGSVTRPSSGIIIFSNITGLTIAENGTKNLILIINYNALTNGDSLKGIVNTSNIIADGTYTGEEIKSENSVAGIIKFVPVELYVLPNPVGDSQIKYLTTTPENDVELIAFKLSASVGEDVIINNIEISLAYQGGFSDTDLTNCRLYVDLGTAGTYDSSSDVLLGTVATPSSGKINFTGISGLTVLESSVTNLLVVVDHKTLSNGYKVQAFVNYGKVTATGDYTSDSITSYSNAFSVIKQVINQLTVSVTSSGDSSATTLTKSAETYRELMGIRLSAGAGERLIVERIRLSLDYYDGAVDTDFTNIRLFIDLGTTGTYDGADVLLATNIEPSAGIVVFSNISGLTVPESGITNLLVTIGHIAMESGEGVKGIILTNWVSYYGETTSYTDTSVGSGQGITKEVPGTLIIQNNDTGDCADGWLSSAAENEKEIISIHLSATKGEDIRVTEIIISLEYFGGVAKTNFKDAWIYKDEPVIGDWVGGVDTVNYGNVFNFSNYIKFSNISGLTVFEQSSIDIILQLDHNAGLVSGEGIRGFVKSGMISAQGLYTIDNIANISNAIGRTKIVGGELYVSALTTGDSANTSLTRSTENYHELIAIKLSANNAEDVVVNRLKLTLVYTNSAVDTDFTNARLYVDLGTTGTYEAADNQIGTTVLQPSSAIVEFTNITGLTISAGNTTNLLITIGHKVMSSGEGVSARVENGFVEYYGLTSGVTNTSLSNAIGVLKLV
ncbi:MAG: hypothetical protein DRO92_04850, partial [Candidatus Altiarchaeales archaeon]